MSRPNRRIDPAGARRSSPDSAAISSCWPLPETPAMPTISPARTSKRDARPASMPNGSSFGKREAAHRRARPRRRCACAVLQLRRLGADHQARQAGVGLLRRVDLAGHLAAAQHRAVMAQRADLVELVADVEDASSPRLASLRSVTKSVCDRLRRQHRGRLVEDQQLRARSSARARSRRAGARRPRACAPAAADRRRGRTRAATLRMRSRHLGQRERLVEAQPDVLGRGQRVEQAEVLEHHADAERARLLRVADLDRAAPFQRISPSSGRTAP